MKEKIKKIVIPSLFIILVTCFLFAKMFTRGFVPVPGDLLVSFYFPWYSGGWQGYDPWTTRKELIAADSIRQIYPWKEFAAESFKRLELPLWNPYSFSGQPLLANFQSSVFYPLNIFYFLTNSQNAWILLIVSQAILGSIFMYLATRSFKISTVPSLFSSLSFLFSSYFIGWLENGNITHSYIWLPAAFWAINKYMERFQFRYLLILTFSLSLSILAGHPQTAIYIYSASALFLIYKLSNNKNLFSKKIYALPFVVLFSILISAIQLIPTFEFYQKSPISLPFSKELFDRFVLPPQNLVTFFASDFYGNPATNNFWSENYGDFTPYLGVIPFIFALWAIKKFRTQSFVRFATLTLTFFILAALPGPITFLIKYLNVPLLDSTSSARFISVSLFLLCILSAVGFEDFLKHTKTIKYQRRFRNFLIFILAIYATLWAIAIFGSNFLEPRDVWETNLAVTRRNLILPTAMMLTVFFTNIGLIYLNVVKKFSFLIVVLSVFTFTLLGGFYFSNKFLPFAPKYFIFPDHPLFKYLNENAGYNRFYGGGTAHIDFNFPAHYQIFGAEGYDTLRLERYAQLLAASFSGKVPSSYLRSDAVFPTIENGYRKRLFDLLAVKYLLDKEDNPVNGNNWHYERFSGDEVRGFWQDGKFQVYVRRTALPRTFLTTKYTVSATDEQIIQKIFDSKFDLKTLVLEEEPSITIADIRADIALPKIVIYRPNQVVIETNESYNSLLFLSDSYDPDWNVYLDKNKAVLLRAHYALRSVAVPAGKHRVEFKYEPISFKWGFAVSLSTAIMLIIISIYFLKKKNF